MSKLLDAIEARQHEHAQRRIGRQALPRVVDIKTEIRQDPVTLQYAYSINLMLGVTHRFVKPDDIYKAVEHVRADVREFVFGEFRKPLLDITSALWDDDVEGARELLEGLRKQMFK